MKLKLTLVFFAVLAFILFAKWRNSHDVPIVDNLSSAKQASSAESLSKSLDASSESSINSQLPSQSNSSTALSSVKSLSGVRVDPLPEIAHFLRQLDKATIPKIYLPTPKQDPLFDYTKAKADELKDKAMAGDPYAANFYAEYIVKSKVRTISDKGVYVYESDLKKRALAMNEAREFYIRGFRGGIASNAETLSRLYANPFRGGNRIESLAWRKISFAVGESERYECLRNSTICIVKEFNNLNRPEYFYPCLSSSGDSCTQDEYDSAMVLALEYADSLEFAMNNKVGQ